MGRLNLTLRSSHLGCQLTNSQDMCYVCLAKKKYNSNFAAHVRTVLLQQQQQQRLFDDAMDCVKIVPNGSEFYTLTTTASPPHPIVPLSSLTLRSIKSAQSGYSSSKKVAGKYCMYYLFNTSILR